METATIVQRNISMDVKNGIMKMEELLQLIAHQRNSRMAAEVQLMEKHISSAAPTCTKCCALSLTEGK